MNFFPKQDEYMHTRIYTYHIIIIIIIIII